MYFKSLQVKGFKGFSNSGVINFSIPDGETPGSGLNIFVGENGSGKTAILKAISLLTVNSFSGQSKISSSDFYNQSDDGLIDIVGTLEEYINFAMVPPWKQTLKIKEFHVQIKHRDRKTPGKLLSPKYTISNVLEPISRTPSWYKSGEINDFYLGFTNDRFDKDEALNVFLFTEDRNKQAKKGFSTTFSRVMDDLNWRFLNDANQQSILEQWNKYREMVIASELGGDIKTAFKENFGRDDLSNVQLELLSLKEPFSEAFFALSSKDNLSQIPLENLGSGIELLFSILFLRQVTDKSKGTIMYCIDEPELSLHPQWQKILFYILKEESKTRQIFIATHSLHFIDPSLLGNVKKFGLIEGEPQICNVTELQAEDKKIKDLLTLENREIFFSRKTILVEGWEDRSRFRKFLSSQNNELFVICGLQNLDRMRGFCNSLKIGFKAIVDLDYLRNYPDLIPDLENGETEAMEEIKQLNKMIESTESEKLIKEINKLKDKIEKDKLRCLASKMLIKMQSDYDYKLKIEAKIAELKEENIFILPNGLLEDYLKGNGEAKSESLKTELTTIINS